MLSLTTAWLPTTLAIELKENPVTYVESHNIINIGGFWLTNHMLLSALAAVLVFAIFYWVASRVRVNGITIDDHLTRGSVAQTFEVMCVFIREQVARPALGELTDRYIGYVWTVFFFVLFSNLIGLVPIGAIATLFSGGKPTVWEHLNGSPTGNIMMTGALAFVSLFMIVFMGIRHNGKNFFTHFCPIEMSSWGMTILGILLVPLEVMSLLIRVCVLALRLFGNMLAGHLVIAALIILIFAFQSIAFYAVGAGIMVANLALTLLEIFVAFLQAFIFTLLTVVYIASGAVAHDEHHGGGHGESTPEGALAQAGVDHAHQPVPAME